MEHGAADTLRVWGLLLGAEVRARLQYKASFAVGTLVDFAVIISDFAPVYLLATYFGHLQGWSFAELALLYGMVGTSWGLVDAFMRGFSDFGGYLISGEMDRWLLRPRPLLLQISAWNFEARKIGRILQALLVLTIASIWLELGLGALAWVVFGIAGGTLFFAGVLLAGAASQFWTLGQTTELQNILTYGGSATLSYPVSIYADWFRRAITWAIPLAFVNYFPAIAALGRTSEAGWPPWLPWLSPLFCCAALAVGLGAFFVGLRRYESTGS